MLDPPRHKLVSMGDAKPTSAEELIVRATVKPQQFARPVTSCFAAVRPVKPTLLLYTIIQRFCVSTTNVNMLPWVTSASNQGKLVSRKDWPGVPAV